MHNMNIPFFPSFSVVEPLHNCFKKIHTLGAFYTFCKTTSNRVISLCSENNHVTVIIQFGLILEKLSVKMSISYLEND